MAVAVIIAWCPCHRPELCIAEDQKELDEFLAEHRDHRNLLTAYEPRRITVQPATPLRGEQPDQAW